MKVKTIAIGCDHVGFPYKGRISALLKSQGMEVLDFGTQSTESVDYPDFVHPVANSIEKGDADLGVIICGSGNGVAMTANKHQGIRAAVCWTEELAILARQHNDANVIALPARFVSIENALSMVKSFLETEFEAGRHTGRVAKIANY